MTIDDAVNKVKAQIASIAADAVFRIKKMSDEEARISVYVAADKVHAITDGTRDMVIQLLSHEGLDVQVFPYDITATAPPPE